MNFDDQDWEAEDPSSRDPQDHSTAWKVAAGIAVGVVLGATLVWGLDRYVLPATPSGLVQARESTPCVGPTAESGQRAAPRPAVSTPDTLATPDQALRTSTPEQAHPAESRQREAAVETQREPDAGQYAAQLAAQRKERAWASFYSKPAACDDIPTKATLVECANDFIRAKRRFEAWYAAGRPRPGKGPASASASVAGQ